MSYAVYDDYRYNQNFAYNPHDLSPHLAHEEFFPDQPRSNPGRHGSHGSFGQFDAPDYQFHDSQYVARAAPRYSVNYHPTTVSASAIEDNRGSYSPGSSPISRHSDNLASSPMARPSKPTSPSPPDDRAYCTHRDCLDSDGISTKSFSRKADVARHIRSAHERRYLDCPFRKCVRKGDQGFTRNDHLVEHRRQFHMESIPKKGAGAKWRAGVGEKGRHDT